MVYPKIALAQHNVVVDKRGFVGGGGGIACQIAPKGASGYKLQGPTAEIVSPIAVFGKRFNRSLVRTGTWPGF